MSQIEVKGPYKHSGDLHPHIAVHYGYTLPICVFFNEGDAALAFDVADALAGFIRDRNTPLPSADRAEPVWRAGAEGIGASYHRDDDCWHFYTMPGVKPMGLTLKGYDDVDAVIGLLRKNLDAANACEKPYEMWGIWCDGHIRPSSLFGTKAVAEAYWRDEMGEDGTGAYTVRPTAIYFAPPTDKVEVTRVDPKPHFKSILTALECKWGTLPYHLKSDIAVVEEALALSKVEVTREDARALLARAGEAISAISNMQCYEQSEHGGGYDSGIERAAQELEPIADEISAALTPSPAAESR